MLQPTNVQFLLALGLVTLLNLGCHANDVKDDAVFFHQLKKRTGHFYTLQQEDPTYWQIYAYYFKNVIKKNDKSMESLTDLDWRTVRPTNEMCLDFLHTFQARQYQLQKPYEIVPLDACLGVLHENDKSDLDRFSKVTVESFKKLRNNQKLRKIYDETHFKTKTVPSKLLHKLFDYIIGLLDVYADSPTNLCHDFWMERYVRFIEDVYLDECEEEEGCVHFGWAEAEKDSYIKLLLESTKQAALSCYEIIQSQMHDFMISAYDDGNTISVSKTFGSKNKALVRQLEDAKWTREMVRILQLLSNSSPDQPIKLSEVAKNIYQLKKHNKDAMTTITSALEAYANDKVDFKATTGDPFGRIRYAKVMVEMCRPYVELHGFLIRLGANPISKEYSARKPFDFFGLIYSLVSLTNQVPTFKISKETFEQDVLDNKWEALYLTTYICQLIGTSWAEISKDRREPAYKVILRMDEISSLFWEWPFEVIYNRLAPGGSNDPETSGKEKENLFRRLVNLKGSRDKSPVKEARPDSIPAPVVAKKLIPASVAPQEPDSPPTARDFGRRHEFKKSSREPMIDLAKLSPPNEPVFSSPTSYKDEPDLGMMSLKTIEMFRKLYGHYPATLPDHYYDLYPSLKPYTVEVERKKPDSVPRSTVTKPYRDIEPTPSVYKRSNVDVSPVAKPYRYLSL